jgi:hypothetical protein
MQDFDGPFMHATLIRYRWAHLALKPLLVLSLGPLSWAVQAQEAAVQDWREANETVARHPRGHADVLRWEQARAPAAEAKAPRPAFALDTAADAVRAAWATHPELAVPLAQLGQDNANRVATGDWLTLDPGLQRRIHGVDELLEQAAGTRKAWLRAVAARQAIPPLQEALTATEAAAELGRRMVSLGHWSRLQQAQVAWRHAGARQALTSARLAAAQAEQALLQAMGLARVHERVALPDRLPDTPLAPINETELLQRIHGLQAQLPRAEGRQAASLARQAYAAYSASLEIHLVHRDERLKTRELMAEETLLRYNGMLDSVWTLLAEVEARAQARVAAIAAQRDSLVAETDLLWVLHGGQPQAFVSLQSGEPAAAAKAGH